MFLPMVIIMGLNASGIDFKSPDIIMYARILFGVMQALCIGIYAYIGIRSKKLNDQTTITIKKKPGVFAAATATANGDTNAASGTSEQQTVVDYDLEQIKSQLKSALIGSAITCFIHYKWEFVPPLILQAVLNPINLFSSPLFMIHVLGKKAEGELKRPFTEENPTAGLFGGLTGNKDEKKDDDATPADTADTKDSKQVSTSSTKSARKRKEN